MIDCLRIMSLPGQTPVVVQVASGPGMGLSINPDRSAPVRMNGRERDVTDWGDRKHHPDGVMFRNAPAGTDHV
jgi:hypothetical protein